MRLLRRSLCGFLYYQERCHQAALRMQGDSRDVCERLCRHDSQNLIEHTRTSSSAPSARAIRMACAIMVERLLTTGKFGGATALAKQIGASRPYLTTLLDMPDLPPAHTGYMQ